SCNRYVRSFFLTLTLNVLATFEKPRIRELVLKYQGCFLPLKTIRRSKFTSTPEYPSRLIQYQKFPRDKKDPDISGPEIFPPIILFHPLAIRPIQQ
ncbi:hypothetical protein B0I37DRAFT_342556, partial [Chaetomium sp. MPI-CAGE-AT-0009]